MKILRLLLIFLCVFVFAGLATAAVEPGKPLRILASTFPVYLFTQNVCREVPDVEVELLIPAQAGCPHDFALKPADMAKLDKADVLVINGDGLEEFLDRLLAGKTGLKVVNAGMNVPTLDAASSGHGHEHVNPHIFAAPAQAAMMSNNIAEALSNMDSNNAILYKKNAAPYVRELLALDEAFAVIGAMARNRKIAIAHDGLAYLMANAGLEVVAIMENTDSIARLSALKKALMEDRPVLLAGDSQYPDRLLKTISGETGIPYVLLNTCASGPQNPPLDFYQQEMKKNLEILEKYFE